MVPLYHRDKIVLVAFGGNKKDPSNKVKLLLKNIFVCLFKELHSYFEQILGKYVLVVV
jgi:hypothetical protein